MFRRKDLLIITAAVVLAACLYAVFTWQNSKGTPNGTVNVYVSGKLYTAAHLGQAEPVVILQENGEKNIITFTSIGCYMSFSSCRNQLCVHQGEVTTENYTKRYMGKQIICLPNRVTVELVITGETPEEAPDV